MSEQPESPPGEPSAGEARAASPALVAGHAGFADGIVSAVAQITGEGARFITMSNRDMGAAEIERRMREMVETAGVRVIFTDLPAGSVTIAARRVLRDRADVTLVTGANLAVLLHWLSHGEEPGHSEHDVAAGAAERGKGSILVVGNAGGR